MKPENLFLETWTLQYTTFAYCLGTANKRELVSYSHNMFHVFFSISKYLAIVPHFPFPKNWCSNKTKNLTQSEDFILLFFFLNSYSMLRACILCHRLSKCKFSNVGLKCGYFRVCYPQDGFPKLKHSILLQAEYIIVLWYWDILRYITIYYETSHAVVFMVWQLPFSVIWLALQCFVVIKGASRLWRPDWLVRPDCYHKLIVHNDWLDFASYTTL